MHLFHKWEYLFATKDDSFLSENVLKKWKRFRRCKKCSIVQEVRHYVTGHVWNTLSAEKAAIVNERYSGTSELRILKPPPPMAPPNHNRER